MVQLLYHERPAHHDGACAAATGPQPGARRAHCQSDAGLQSTTALGGAELVRVTVRQDHQVTSSQTEDGAVSEDQLAASLGEDVDPAEPGSSKPMRNGAANSSHR